MDATLLDRKNGRYRIRDETPAANETLAKSAEPYRTELKSRELDGTEITCLPLPPSQRHQTDQTVRRSWDGKRQDHA